MVLKIELSFFLWAVTLRFTNVRRLGAIFAKRLLDVSLILEIKP